MIEIERKFLVKGDAWRGLAEPLRIRQGYVPTKDGTTVSGFTHLKKVLHSTRSVWLEKVERP